MGDKYLELAAQCWCKPTTKHLVMIPELAEVFAETLKTFSEQNLALRQSNKELVEMLEKMVADIDAWCFVTEETLIQAEALITKYKEG